MSYLLCVDDDDSIRMLICKILANAGHIVQAFPDGRTALSALEAREPELVVLDLAMPGMTGIEVCRSIKENPFTAHIPVLLLTAQSEIEDKVEAFEAGADDYLVKPFHPQELLARVLALLRLVRRESDRNPSSGLPGGRAIQEEIERCVGLSQPFAICHLDLDNFKPFADTFGFTVADTVIRETGAIIRKVVEDQGRPTDFVGHIGGDDFIIVTGVEQAERMARECSTRFREVVARIVGAAATQRGTFTGLDRDGFQREFPITQLSAAVLLVNPEQWVSLGHVGTLAADVKRRAKQNGPGTILVQAT